MTPRTTSTIKSLYLNNSNISFHKMSVGYIGELNELTLTPNPDEVDQLFTVPLADLLDKNKWVIRDFSTPVFTGIFVFHDVFFYQSSSAPTFLRV